MRREITTTQFIETSEDGNRCSCKCRGSNIAGDMCMIFKKRKPVHDRLDECKASESNAS